MYRLDNHILCAVAGITADANILVSHARASSQQYLYSYQEPCPVEYLVRGMCDLKQGYTQYGGQRPFGVSFLYAGWDKHLGFQLYTSDPSGNYGGWKAYSIGSGKQAADSILKSDYTEGMTLRAAEELVIKVLSKTIDSTSLNSEVGTHYKFSAFFSWLFPMFLSLNQIDHTNICVKPLIIVFFRTVELASLRNQNGKMVNHVYTAQEVDDLLATVHIEKEED